MKAIVVGAGPGGLTAAIALQRIGWEVAVFERQPVLEPAGAGVALYQNAVRALASIGLGDAVTPAGVAIERAQIRTWRGEVLTAGEIGRLSTKLGVPALTLHRADLQRVLLDATGSPTVRVGFACTGFTQTRDRVIARFANGHEESGDVLVGADGLHSAIRSELLGAEPPRYAGYTCWRGIATFDPREVPPNCGVESWGRGGRFGLFRVIDQRVYWFATANMQEGLDTPGARKDDVARRFHGWHEPIPSLIAATPEEAILRNDIFDRRPTARWGEGRVTLLGDAAHPMTPNLAQGAGTAIEDAIRLAALLRNSAQVEAALRQYERERQARTAPLVSRSRLLGRIGQLSHPAACFLRDHLVKLTPDWVTERQLASVVGA